MRLRVLVGCGGSRCESECWQGWSLGDEGVGGSGESGCVAVGELSVRRWHVLCVKPYRVWWRSVMRAT